MLCGVTSTPDEFDRRKPPAWRGWVLAALCVLLLATAAGKLRAGFYDLATSLDVRPTVGPPVDLRYRWVEWRYVFERGQSPFDVYLHDRPEGPVRAARASAGEPDAGLGPVLRAPYPPWSYPLATAVLAWDWPAARWAMAAVDAAGLLALAAAGGWFARGKGWPVVAVCAALAVAAAQHYTVLRLGQPAVVVVALLAGALVVMTKAPRADFVAGMLLGAAMLKPTLAVPFVVVVLLRRRWWAAAGCAAVVAAGAAVTWARVGVDPLTMTRQMLAIGGQIEASKGLADGIADGPVLWLRAAGLSSTAAARVTAVVVLAMLAAALWATRRRPVWVAFALAALAAQLWAHHKPYDEIVMLPLVLPATAALLARWRRAPNLAVAAASIAAAGILMLTLVHLGLLRLAGPRAFGAFQLAVWLVTIFWLTARPSADDEVVPAGEHS